MLGIYVDATYITIKGGGLLGINEWDVSGFLKYPFFLGDIALFPMLGVNYDGDLYTVIGGGLDYYLRFFDRIYFRLDLGYGINVSRFANASENYTLSNSGSNSSAAYYSSPFGKFFVTVGTGWRF